MLIFIVIIIVLLMPLVTGIYYATRGVALKQRQTAITGFALIIAWCVIMYIVSDGLYHMYYEIDKVQ